MITANVPGVRIFRIVMMHDPTSFPLFVGMITSLKYPSSRAPRNEYGTSSLGSGDDTYQTNMKCIFNAAYFAFSPLYTHKLV